MLATHYCTEAESYGGTFSWGDGGWFLNGRSVCTCEVGSVQQLSKGGGGRFKNLFFKTTGNKKISLKLAIRQEIPS